MTELLALLPLPPLLLGGQVCTIQAFMYAGQVFYQSFYQPQRQCQSAYIIPSQSTEDSSQTLGDSEMKLPQKQRVPRGGFQVKTTPCDLVELYRSL